VLQRSYTRQHSLEKQFKNFGIPYNADRPAGLFSDAPVNDLYNFLRLLVYPEDHIAYAALIRSPFMRLSDLTLSVCLLNYRGLPFDEALEDRIPPEDLELYRRGRVQYREAAEAARRLPITALLTKLWYGDGYRYETLWSPDSQIYGELFDLFFELARDADARGKTPAEFLDYLTDLINREEKADDLTVPAEREAGVRLMSIHKSKGLEFPVVFVYNCTSGSTNNANAASAYFSEHWGVTINLPQADELPSDSGNYFYNLRQEREEKKREAELRRLLYVAMTRAESALFITGSLPASTNDEKKAKAADNTNYGDTPIGSRICLLNAVRKADRRVNSFFDLLLPVIASGEGAPFAVMAIPILSRQELYRQYARDRRRRETGGGQAGLTRAPEPPSMEEAAVHAAPFYAGAGLITAGPAGAVPIPASSLSYKLQSGQAPSPVKTDAIDRLLEAAGLTAAEFGTIVHNCLEAAIKGKTPLMPPKFHARLNEKQLEEVQEAARSMAENFLKSDLGRRSLEAKYLESEFPILTTLTVENKTIPVTGQIDLVFEWEEHPGDKNGTIMYVVDFKTDHEIEPERHLGQLAVYARAVSDIFGKPVRSWLFYLRSRTARELTGDIEKVIIEDMVSVLR
jgi:ATP-dependent helicase/nuclease subunit A